MGQFFVASLAGGDSLMCCIVTIWRQIARMFSTFSLWWSLFLMPYGNIISCYQSGWSERVSCVLWTSPFHAALCTLDKTGFNLITVNTTSWKGTTELLKLKLARANHCLLQYNVNMSRLYLLPVLLPTRRKSGGVHVIPHPVNTSFASSFITSRVSGRGYKNGAVRVCVSVR